VYDAVAAGGEGALIRAKRVPWVVAGLARADEAVAAGGPLATIDAGVGVGLIGVLRNGP
jgi:hypothetical protein